MSLVNDQATSYEPKTSLGKTMSEYKSIRETTIKKIIKEAQDCYNDLVKKYPCEPPLYSGKKGDIVKTSFTVSKKEMTLDDLSYILPDPEQKRFSIAGTTKRSSSSGGIVGIKEENLQRIKEMEQRIEEDCTVGYGYSPALKLDIDGGKGGISEMVLVAIIA